MDIANQLVAGLRAIVTVIPIEMALTLGVLFFGLSWVRPRRLISLPESPRALTLARFGIAAPLVVVAVASATSWMATLDPIERHGGWWQRAAPLLTTAVVLAILHMALRQEPSPAAGERAIAPRRGWWYFVSRALLTLFAVIAGLLLALVLWQIIIGVTLPEGGNRYGVGPAERGLPEFMVMQQGMGYVWGVGWPNDLATLIALIAATFMLVRLLSVDANRPTPVARPVSELRSERTIAARMTTLVALGGVLLTLGATCAHVGFIGEIIVGVFEDNGGAENPQRFFIGTGYSSVAPLLHRGGYIVQGIGAALLLRIFVDTWRAVRSLRRSPDAASARDARSARTEALAGDDR